ncbi:MAG TPA: retropepsin-like aspartic protease [Acidobacteriaceae bacterium]|nr:retropepsin-like aspartic protease [Acidobacteriaceae bacterium]
MSEARRQTLIAKGMPVPLNVEIRALIDTGASGTCIDPSVIEQLGIPATGSTLVCTPTTGTRPAMVSQYDISIVIPAGNQPAFVFPNLAVMESKLLGAIGYHALIGRDVLEHCIFHYNGSTGFFTLAY